MNYEETVTGSFTLKHAIIKTVKADLLAGNVTISFAFTLDEETLHATKHLQHLFGDEKTVLDLIVIEKQLQLTLPHMAPEEGPATTLTVTNSKAEQVTADLDTVSAAMNLIETKNFQ